MFWILVGIYKENIISLFNFKMSLVQVKKKKKQHKIVTVSHDKLICLDQHLKKKSFA